VILMWAWPAREPPARSHDPVTPTRVEAAAPGPAEAAGTGADTAAPTMAGSNV
jgi:hypothetical protein